METKLLPEIYEFSDEERAELVIKFNQYIQDPAKYPLAPAEKEKALRAANEHSKVKAYLTSIEAKLKRAELSDRCKSKKFAIDVANQVKPNDPLEAMLTDQLAAAHTAAMLLLSELYEENAFGDISDRSTNTAIKLMKAFQTGYETLHRVRNSGKQTIVVQHQNVQINGGQAVVANEIRSQPEGVGNEN
ncbi:MAG: hypothetical protein K0Q57_436 [Gammaproteobacteria bacterium]|jgi:hypothetical protein|nr:hypothetical protein [Gammaproteobacteria bacterium]